MIPAPKNLNHLAASVSTSHENFIVENINDHCIRLAINENVTYEWHNHPDSDEFFIVLEGQLTIEFLESAPVILKPGDVWTVQAKTIHRTIATGRTINLCFERTTAQTTFIQP